MVKTKDEILTSIKSKFGEDTSDETLALMEDVSDTLKDLESKANSTTDWKAKYEENDKAWREKYRDRFFNSSGEENTDNEEDDKPNYPTRFEDLFTKEG